MSTPDVDFTYLSLGGGVQSSTIAEMVVEGELPAPDMVLFADTGDEPGYVYKHVDYLHKRLRAVGLGVTVVAAGNLIDDLMSGKGRFAAIPAFAVNDGRRGRLRRQCTREYKIEPIEKAVRQELFARGLATKTSAGSVLVAKSTTVEAWIGISLDEVQRMKPSFTKWVKNRWPLVEKRMSRADCRLWLDARRLPIPGRSSCRICPYHNDEYWRSMKASAPEDWQFVVDFDNSLRDSRASRFVATASGELFLHSSCVPLVDVDLRTPEQHGQLRLFDNDETVCDGGYCFI